MNIRPNTVAIVTGIVIFFILLSLAQEVNRQWQVEREVQLLQAEVHEMEASIIELENLNQYFRTDDFQERLAREKLNYRAAGEEVVLLPEQELFPDSDFPGPATESSEATYPLQWWDAFFGNDIPIS